MKKQLTLNMIDALTAIGITIDLDRRGSKYYYNLYKLHAGVENRKEDKCNKRLARTNGRTSTSIASRVATKVTEYGCDIKATYAGRADEVDVPAEVLKQLKG